MIADGIYSQQISRVGNYRALLSPSPAQLKGGAVKVRDLYWTFRTLLQEGGGMGAAIWFMLSVLKFNSTVRVRIRGERLTVRIGTPDVDVALSCLCGEFSKLISLKPVLSHGFIIDAGGYIGTAAIVFAKAYPEAKIVTIEPSKANFFILRKNTDKYPNIIAINAALGTHEGQLQLRDRGTGSWGFTIVAQPEDNREAEIIEAVRCTTVPELLKSEGHSFIDIIKIDIEGAEKELLTQPNEWISKADVICIELHDRIIGGCTQAFERATQGRINSKLDGEKFISLKVANLT